MQRPERVVALSAAVVDQIETDLPCLLVDPVQGEDAGRVDDRGVKAGLDALVQEDRVENLPGGGIEAEGDVGQSEHGVHARSSSALMRRIPSMVSMPSRRLSSIPVESGSARGSKNRSSGARP